MGGKRTATLLTGYGRLAHDVPKARGLGRGSRPRLHRTGSHLRSGRACKGYLGWSPVPRQQEAADRSAAVGALLPCRSAMCLSAPLASTVACANRHNAHGPGGARTEALVGLRVIASHPAFGAHASLETGRTVKGCVKHLRTAHHNAPG